MRMYSKGQERKQPVRVLCNCCGRELEMENGVLLEECIHMEHDFGFFGSRDGESDCFDLCGECYQKITSRFSIAPQSRERTELL